MSAQAQGKKPRIRKSAPTVRERLEAAKADSNKQAPGSSKKVPRKLTAFLNRFSKYIAKPLRALGMILRPVRWLVVFITPRYLINSWREVRQVVWPNRKETWRLTLAVFVFAIVFGALVAVVDKGLDEVFKKVVLR